LLSQRQGTTTNFYVGDGSANVRALVSSAQSITDSYLFKAFLEELASSGSSNNALWANGMLGVLRDAPNRNAMRARVYSALKARFTVRDPIGFLGGLPNLYSFVANGPVRWSDPSGLSQDPGQPSCYTGISVAVYIPTLLFPFLGWDWYGDDRRTSANSPRYRLQLNLWINNFDGYISNVVATTTESRAISPWGWLWTGKPNPILTISHLILPSDGSVWTYINAEAHDALLDVLGYHGAPSAGVMLNLHTLADGKVFAQLNYENYPATEAYKYTEGLISPIGDFPPGPGTNPLTLLSPTWSSVDFEAN